MKVQRVQEISEKLMMYVYESLSLLLGRILLQTVTVNTRRVQGAFKVQGLELY